MVNSKGFSNKQTGQAIIELVLALPLLMLLVVGALEFGRAFQTKIVLTNAAREGTHYFIYDTDDSSVNFASTKTAVITEASNNTNVTIEEADITVLCFVDSNGDGIVDATEINNSCPSGSTVEVTVQNMFDIAVIGTFTSPVQITSNARMLVP